MCYYYDFIITYCHVRLSSSNRWALLPFNPFFLVQLKIEDASRRLRSGDMGIPTNPDERFETWTLISINHWPYVPSDSYVIQSRLKSEIVLRNEYHNENNNSSSFSHMRQKSILIFLDTSLTTASYRRKKDQLTSSNVSDTLLIILMNCYSQKKTTNVSILFTGDDDEKINVLIFSSKII